MQLYNINNNDSIVLPCLWLSVFLL